MHINTLILKSASEADEFDQIIRLNYKTFSQEIPQHPENEEQVLVDKFHSSNQYLIAKKDKEVIGMVCYNCQRPFSLDSKVPKLDSYLPAYKNLAEVRLLSVKSEERRPTVAYRLLQFLCSELTRKNIDMAVISGTTRQLHLYRQMGFTPFYELVGKPDAWYQPMYITVNTIRDDFRIR